MGVWPTIGTNGFSMVFPLETMVFQWFWVWQTIGTDGFSMVFSLETMVFQWFPMVANHWSNDGMVTIHRRGLIASIGETSFFFAEEFSFLGVNFLITLPRK